MKRCTHCGKEYPDDTNFCPIDGHAVIDPAHPPSAIPPPVLLKSAPQPKATDASKKPADPHAPKKSADGRYLRYEDVPWYRREPGLLAFVGVMLCGFITIALCIICLTGDVYKNKLDRKGNLEVWGVQNKIAAVVILVIQGFILWLYHWSQQNQ
jgi:hypothetical protein